MVISTSIIQGIHTVSTLNITLPFIQKLSMTEIFKCILNVYMYRLALGNKNVEQISWLQGYAVVIILGSAGSITANLLRGAPIDVLHKTDFWIIYGIIYWVLFYNPSIFNRFHSMLTNFSSIKSLLVGLSGINKGYGLIRLGIDKEKGLIAKVIFGVLVSCGGSLWFELFGLGGVDWKFSTPRQFLAPSNGVKAALWTTLLYLIVCLFIENQEEAHAIGSVFYALLLAHNSHKVNSGQNKNNNSDNGNTNKAKKN